MLTNFEVKYFPNFANSKTEVVRYSNLLLQASTYNILASIGQRNQMPHYWYLSKNSKTFQKLKNSNKLLLETFSNWAKIRTKTSLTKIRVTQKRASNFELIKALKTWIFFTARHLDQVCRTNLFKFPNVAVKKIHVFRALKNSIFDAL